MKHPPSESVQPVSAPPTAAPRGTAPAAKTRGPRVALLYAVEGVTSHAVTLMLASIYFYTTARFGWDSGKNFMLAAALGAVYVIGALRSHAVSVRFGRRRTLVAAYAAMSAAAGCALLVRDEPGLLVPVLLFYSAASAVTWPALESLVSSGAGAGELSRRLGVYNCVWSGAGALTVAAAGLVLKYWPAGTFVLPTLWHLAMALLLWAAGRPGAASTGGGMVGEGEGDAAAEQQPAPHAAPEPELLAVRTLALWMSRLALPATFVVISSLLAAMPTLPLVRRLDPATRTVLGSVWMAARWGGFVFLGATVWWHTRPRALLAAAAMLLAGFVAITFRPEWLPGRPDVLNWAWLPGPPDVPTAAWVAWMVAWQVVLGLALGLIYSASLYFGMVLSDGSTEHGGYHEALIGLGMVIGPGAGAAAEKLGGGDPLWGVAAVSVVLALSVAACATVAARRNGTASRWQGSPRAVTR